MRERVREQREKEGFEQRGAVGLRKKKREREKERERERETRGSEREE